MLLARTAVRALVALPLRAAVVSVLLLAPAPGAAADAPRQRQGRVTMEVQVKAPEGAREVRVWIPYPVSDADQEITGAAVTGNPTATGVHKDPGSGSSILYAEWKGAAGERRLTYAFTVLRREVLHRELADAGEKTPRGELAEHLDLSWLGGSEQRIREQAAAVVGDRTSTLEKARAIYEWVADNMRRDPDAKACGSCDVERLLSARMGKCADVHTVFVALCRAAGVPARDLWGIRLPKEKEGDMTKRQHCWAEFFLPGTGWVPVDVADVHKVVLERKLSAAEAKSLPERAYFFGSIEENRVLLGSARGALTPPQAAGPLVYFMYPYAEADGRPLGEDINFNFGYAVTFREL